MPAPQAPNAAPVFNWEKANSQLKSPRKKGNPLIVFAVVAMVVLAASGVWRAMHAPAPGQWVQVVAAARDLPAGSRLGFTQVKYMQVPKKFFAKDMVVSLNDVTGRTTRSFIAQGEPVTTEVLFSGHAGVSGSLETHERAITLQLPDDALVDHSIVPDDLVDILVVTNKDGKKYTKTICQSARVLMTAPREQAMDRRTSGSSNKITLAVTPELAESVTEAVETGKVRLVLRSRLSRTEPALQGSDQDDLLPASAFVAQRNALEQQQSAKPSPLAMVPMPPPPAIAAAPEPDVSNEPKNPLQWIVEVISGNKKESYGVPAL
jgi:pilus assembly protein CpaB